MARSKNSRIDPKTLTLVGVAALVVVAGALFFSLGSSRAFSGLSAFPVDRYLDSAGIFSQEDFRIDGRVENVLLRSGGGRRFLVSIRPEGSDLILPVLVESKKKPLQRDQRLVMKVHVAANGGILCTDYDIR
jgi:hypothetical protein